MFHSASEEHRKRRQQCHEQRRAILAPQALDLPSQIGVDTHDLRRGLLCRTRLGQRFPGQRRDRGRVSQARFPIGEVIRELRSLHRFLCHSAKSPVLNRQIGQGRGFAGRARAVRRTELFDEYARGPTIENDVVRDQEKKVVVGSQPQQTNASERPSSQVEGLADRFRDDPVRGSDPLGLSQRRQIFDGARRFRRVQHARVRLAIHGRKHRPQDLVPAGNCLEAIEQSSRDPADRSIAAASVGCRSNCPDRADAGTRDAAARTRALKWCDSGAAECLL